MKRPMKRFSLVLALCLLTAMLPTVTAEDGLEIVPFEPIGEAVLSEPVDEAVGEVEAELRTDVAGTEAQGEDAVSNDGDFRIENGVLVGYSGAGGHVVIPNGVTAIGQDVFYRNGSVTGVTIPSSVTRIGVRAFATTNLKSVTVPASVETIESLAFYNNPELTSVTLEGGIAKMDGYVFQDCRKLVDLTIADGVKCIGNNAFWDCHALVSVTIPGSVATFGDRIFESCINLQRAVFEKGVAEIPCQAFLSCCCLTEVTIPDSVTRIASEAFRNCDDLKSVAIPGSVTTIGDSAFYFCKGLTDLRLSEGLVNIDDHAFRYCSALKEVTIPSTTRYIGDCAFESCNSLIKVTIDSDDIEIGYHAFYNLANGVVFHTHCETPATLWAREQGFTVVASDHTPVVDPAVPPTTTETGLTEGSHCSRCGKVLVEQEVVPKLTPEPTVEPTPTPAPASIAKCKITGVRDKVYTGRPIKPAPVVKDGSKKLKKGVDYTVKYENNTKIGLATLTVKGKGDYTGSKKVTFRINPKAVKLAKVTAGKKKATVKWKKGAGDLTGYEVQYSLKSDFSKAKTVKVKGEKTVKATLTKLTPKKTWYVRVRAYKKVGKKLYTSAWSKTGKAKVK